MGNEQVFDFITGFSYVCGENKNIKTLHFAVLPKLQFDLHHKKKNLFSTHLFTLLK